MYIPASFSTEDQRTIVELIDAFPFATVVNKAAEGLDVSHLPLHREQTGDSLVLCGHMARANPQWKSLAQGAEVLAIFHGPHAYVSPQWYANAENVPTWNYAVVHCYGTATIIEDPERIRQTLGDQVELFERDFERPWQIDLPETYMQRRLKAIVGLDIDVTRVEAKLKLSQNREPADRAGAITGLRAHGGHEGAAVAAWMTKSPRDR